MSTLTEDECIACGHPSGNHFDDGEGNVVCRHNLDCQCVHRAESIADQYYLQTRGYCGNSLMWWKKGKHGYTTDVRRAHVFTKAEAYGQAKVRPTEDFPWRKDYIDSNVEHSVNAEVVQRDHVGAV